MPTLPCLSSLRVSFLQEGIERKDSCCRGSRQRRTSHDAAGFAVGGNREERFYADVEKSRSLRTRKRYRHRDYVILS
jgi:hypothetical protein